MKAEKNILFIIDEVELKYFEFNKLVTNFWLIMEFSRRGHNVSITVKNLLYMESGNPQAISYCTKFDGKELTRSENQTVTNLNEYNVIFFRPDPPVDIDYINASYVLSRVDKQNTLIINSPQAIRDKNEKLYINEFPELAPKNVVSSNAEIIKEFLANEEEIIIKPLNRCFSKGVFYLNTTDKNINSIIDAATNSGRTMVMVQKFMPEVKAGDKRLIYVCGEIFEYCVVKKGTDDFKFNNHTDANLLKGEFTQKDRLIQPVVARKFEADGIYLAGLDVIEGKTIEINITSPCFFIKEINALFGVEFEKLIVDKLEELIRNFG